MNKKRCKCRFVLQSNHRNGLANVLLGEDEDLLATLNLKKPYNFRKSFAVRRLSSSSTSSSPACCWFNPRPLPSPSVCKAVMTDLIARLGELRFAIINSPISAGLKLAPFWNISSTCGNSLCSFTPR